MNLETEAFLLDADSFAQYHQTIYAQEISRRYSAMKRRDNKAYRAELEALDAARTRCHNAVLTHVVAINRLAAAADLPPLYDGIVSEQQPYRREVADAVLAFVRKMILEQR